MSANIQQEVLAIEMLETLVHCPIFQVIILIKVFNIINARSKNNPAQTYFIVFKNFG